MSWRSTIIPHKLPYVPSVQRFNLIRVPLFNKRDEETCNIDKTPMRHWGIEALRSRVMVMHILAWKESASAWCRRQHQAVVEASCQKRQMHFDILLISTWVHTLPCILCFVFILAKAISHCIIIPLLQKLLNSDILYFSLILLLPTLATIDIYAQHCPVCRSQVSLWHPLFTMKIQWKAHRRIVPYNEMAKLLSSPVSILYPSNTSWYSAP